MRLRACCGARDKCHGEQADPEGGRTRIQQSQKTSMLERAKCFFQDLRCNPWCRRAAVMLIVLPTMYAAKQCEAQISFSSPRNEQFSPGGTIKRVGSFIFNGVDASNSIVSETLDTETGFASEWLYVSGSLSQDVLQVDSTNIYLKKSAMMTFRYAWKKRTLNDGTRNEGISLGYSNLVFAETQPRARVNYFSELTRVTAIEKLHTIKQSGSAFEDDKTRPETSPREDNEARRKHIARKKLATEFQKGEGDERKRSLGLSSRIIQTMYGTLSCIHKYTWAMVAGCANNRCGDNPGDIIKQLRRAAFRQVGEQPSWDPWLNGKEKVLDLRRRMDEDEDMIKMAEYLQDSGPVASEKVPASDNVKLSQGTSQSGDSCGEACKNDDESWQTMVKETMVNCIHFELDKCDSEGWISIPRGERVVGYKGMTSMYLGAGMHQKGGIAWFEFEDAGNGFGKLLMFFGASAQVEIGNVYDEVDGKESGLIRHRITMSSPLGYVGSTMQFDESYVFEPNAVIQRFQATLYEPAALAEPDPDFVAREDRVCPCSLRRIIVRALSDETAQFAQTLLKIRTGDVQASALVDGGLWGTSTYGEMLIIADVVLRCAMDLFSQPASAKYRVGWGVWRSLALLHSVREISNEHFKDLTLIGWNNMRSHWTNGIVTVKEHCTETGQGQQILDETTMTTQMMLASFHKKVVGVTNDAEAAAEENHGADASRTVSLIESDVRQRYQEAIDVLLAEVETR